ncbi:MAG TPA: hypothetical protein DCR14_01055 [Acidimicrobiaceae bacterium]|nr:hypothetical protein [Acidimicrobiaceae bacterium]
MRLTGHRAAFAAIGVFLSSVVVTVVAPLAPTPVHAASITVNTAADIAPTAGVYPNDGLCSLRAAITAAQNNSNAHDVNCTPGAPVSGVLDVIQIDPSLAGQTLTLSWNNGSGVQPFDVIYDLNNPLEIIGPTLNAGDFVIDANNAVRPFGVGFGGSVAGSLKLANLTVRGGNGRSNGASGFGVNGEGGAIYLGAVNTGGPITGSQLTLDNVVLRNNQVSDTGRGGAIFGTAPTITNNGGAYISNRANGSGSVGRGGAIFVEEGPATINGYAVLFEGNSANFAGGVIASNAANSNPMLHLERSLLKDNTATNGGVMYLDSTQAGKIVELYDSTVSGGSGVLFTVTNTQTYDFQRVTFVNAGQIVRAGGGTMVNSIVTGTTSCTATGVGTHTGSRNLIDAGACTILNSTDVGDITNLGPLAQNGGPEVQRTYALLDGSTAIDNGDSAYCGTIDARSVERGLDGDNAVDSPQVGDCDIGAYEYARFVVNFVTGTSSVNENAGTGTVGVKLKILDPADNPLTAPLTVNVGVAPGSSAWLGDGTDPFDDLYITGGAVVFPAGSGDGTIVNVPITVFQDDIAELLGEQANLNITGSPTPGVAVAEPKQHELNIQDDDQPGVIVTESGGSTSVSEATPGTGDTITVALQSRPNLELVNAALLPDRAAYGDPADVTMTITPDRDCVINDGFTTGTSASPLVTTILNANWQTGMNLNVFAVDDLWDEDLRDESVPHLCELRFTFASADPLYDATQDAFEVAVQDNDIAGVNVDYVSGTGVLPEGGSATYVYQVSLDTPPDPGKPLPVTPRGPTGVVFQAGDDCLVNGQANVTLQFTGADWNLPKTLTISPVDNMTVQLQHECTITSSISSPDPVYANLDDAPVFSGTPPTLTVDIQDYDPPTVTNDPPFVDITVGTLSVSEATPGTADTVSVVLRRQPLADVDVTIEAPIDGLIAGRQLQVEGGNSVVLTFTPGNWDVPQIVDVTAVDDDYDELDTHSAALNVSISSTAAGFADPALRKVVIDSVEFADSGSIAASITDNDTSEVLYTASGGTTVVAEPNGTDTIALSLATHPYASVTISVGTGDQCAVQGSSVFTVPGDDWNVPQTLTLVAVDDDDVEVDPHACGLLFDVASSDLLYDVLDESFDIEVDDDEVAGVEITAGAPLVVAEVGTTDTIEVVLSGRPSANVTVHFASSDGQLAPPADLTFTPLNWNVPQTATVGAVDDFVDETDPHAADITVSVVSTAIRFSTDPIIITDSVIGDETVGASIADDDTAGITIGDAPFAAAENGGTDTFTVVLDSEPISTVEIAVVDDGLCDASPELLTFTAANWDEPQTVTVTGLNDDIDHLQGCVLDVVGGAVDDNYDGLTEGASGEIIDDDVAGVSLSLPGGPLEVDEATVSTDAYTVVLTSEPLADVTITVANASGDVTATTPLTFTSANWDTPQDVTVTAVDDLLTETSPENATVTHVATSSDPAYDAIAIANVVVSVTDDDIPGLELVESGGSTVVAEPSGTDGVAIALATEPSASVTVTVSTDAQCAVQGANVFTFPAADWNVPQTLTLVAVDDDVVEADLHPCSVDFAVESTDLQYDVVDDSLVIDVDDDEVAGVEITAGAPLTVAEAGATDTFDVVLAGKPSANVVVHFEASSGQIAAPADLTFTPANWDVPQTATVAAIDDFIDETDPHSASLTVSVVSTALGFGTAPIITVDSVATTSVAVEVADDDTAGVTIGGAPFVVAEEGGTDTFTVVLDSQPTADVTVSLTPTGLCTVGPSPLTFTSANWNVQQTVTVTGLNDFIDGGPTCSIGVTASSADTNYSAIARTVNGSVIDNDTAGITVTAGSLTVFEHTASSASYTLVLNSQPIGNVTILVGGGSDVTVTSSVTFTPANWNVAQTVMITAVDDGAIEVPVETVLVAHAAATSPDPLYLGRATASVSVAVVDDDTATTVSVDPDPAGDADTLTLTATVTGGDGSLTGTVQFFVDAAPVGSPVALVAGTASTDVGPLTKATYSITAEYSGDADNDPSSGATSIEVTATPEPDNDEFTVDEDSGPTTFAVLDGDVDGDSDPLEVVSHTDPANGSVTCSASDCTYTPDPDFHGDDSFTYTVSDGLLEASATVVVHVLPLNDPPSVTPITVTVTAGDTITFNVLGGATDVDGDLLTVESYTQPAHGTVTCTPQGSCTYTPAVGYSGPDSFTFVVTDGQLDTTGLAGDMTLAATAPGTVNITVNAAPPTTTRPRGIPETGGDARSSAGAALMLLALGALLIGTTRRRKAAAR